MQGEFVVPVSTLLSFLLVLTRLTGIFIFVPLPGSQAGPSPARAILCLALTIALAPRWPAVEVERASTSLLALWVLSEAALGLTLGLAVSFVAEAFTFGAHVLSMQAGYAYASIIDPTTQADSGILLVIAQLLSGLLFFACGIEGHVLRALADSLTVYPPGSYSITPSIANELLRLATTILKTGLRLALPITGLMLLIDLVLAILGRLHSQIQLVHMSFPVKLLLCIGVLAWMLVVIQPLYESAAASAIRFVAAMAHR
jgi:flagellar biosynthesis protein FliR